MASQADLDMLLAKSAITDVLHRYCRAMDRMDAPMALSCWHAGGTNDHPPTYTGSATGFIEWLWPAHAKMVFTHHVVVNIMIEVDRDRAGSECYTLVTLRSRGPDGVLYDRISQNRYVDTFECINGVWAMRHRQSVDDGWRRLFPVDEAAEANPLVPANNPGAQMVRSARDRSDYSYTVLKGIV